MRWLLPLAVLLALSSSFVAASDPGPKPGFRNLKWGDPPAADMIIVRLPRAPGSLPLDLYWRTSEIGTDEKLLIAGRATSRIDYQYYKRNFCRVQVVWDHVDRDGLEQVGTDLARAWGKADGNKDGERAWSFPDKQTVAILQLDTTDATATLTLADTACLRRAAADAAGIE